MERPIEERFAELSVLAQQRLQLDGQVHLCTNGDASLFGLGGIPAYTYTNPDLSEHTITVTGDDVDGVAILHEFCHAKVNELGFRSVETRTFEETNDSCLGESQQAARRDILWIFAETYADSLLYSVFRFESSVTVSLLVMGYSNVSTLRQIRSERSFLGIGQSAGFRVSIGWARIVGQDARLAMAAQTAFQGRDQDDYVSVYSALSGLPQLLTNGTLRPFGQTEIGTIANAAVLLYNSRLTA